MTYRKTIALLFLLIAIGEPTGADAIGVTGIGRNPSARWIVVSNTKDMTIYMYPSTAHGQGGLAHMWSLINYKSPMKYAEIASPVLSEKFEIEYDCEGARWRTLSYAFHTHPMGNGQTVFSKPESNQWQPVIANHDSEILWKAACKKIAPKDKAK